MGYKLYKSSFSFSFMEVIGEEDRGDHKILKLIMDGKEMQTTPDSFRKMIDDGMIIEATEAEYAKYLLSR